MDENHFFFEVWLGRRKGIFPDSIFRISLRKTVVIPASLSSFWCYYFNEMDCDWLPLDQPQPRCLDTPTAGALACRSAISCKGSSHVIRSSVFACLLHSWLGTTLANLFQHICHLIYHFHRHYAIVFFRFLRIVAFFDGLLYQIEEWVTWQTACLVLIVPCFTKNCCPLPCFLFLRKRVYWIVAEIDSLLYFQLHLSIIQFSYLHKIAYLEMERIREKQTTDYSKLR